MVFSIKKLVSSLGLDALIIENPIDIFYLTHLSVSKGIFIATPEKEEMILDGRYLESAKKKCRIPCRLFEREAWAKEIKGKVGFDSNFTSFASYQKLASDFPHIHWEPILSPLKKMRSQKTAEEIEALRKAAEITLAGQRHMKELLREGISEEELAFEFECFCRKAEASGMSFEPIVAFGENSAYPHHRAGKTLLKKGQVVLMDVGAVFDHYHGDVTRMEFFGDVDERLHQLFASVKRARQKVLSAIYPGVLAGRLDQIAREEFRKEGLEHLFTHSLGHGIGLETHEYPLLRDKGDEASVPLEPGMVFTIEPGLYQPGLGGVRYEDMILMTEEGFINLC